jgi:hypothetical protein
MGFMNRISFATADDPHQKLLMAHQKYFPEVVLFDNDGKLVDTFGGKEFKQSEQEGFGFVTDCRDKKLT